MAIKVLIVDDSALVRKLLSKMIGAYDDLEVVGTAPDPYVARDLIKQLDPDVITLDVEMPRMDGLEFLEKIMRLRPMPVVMISSLTERDSEVTWRALELGAVDFVTKPTLGIADGLEQYADEIAHKLRAAAQARLRVNPNVVAAQPPQRSLATMVSTEKVICIGASTGGTEAIKELLIALPPDVPGILIAQHMPPGFTRSFAARLDRLTSLTVREAQGGERVLPGHVFVAPGDAHLMLKRSGANYVTELSQEPPVNRHRPAVDVLFQSAAQYAKQNAIGIILTGMGKDGARGLLQMKQADSFTIAQNEESCVVYGMPKEAVQIGAVDVETALEKIPAVLLEKLHELGRATRI